MKIKNKIIALLGLTVFLSCGKEEITVLNNLDTNVNPSQDLVDKDIRTRIGYDPRFYYAGFSGSEIKVPLFSIGTYEVGRDIKNAITVGFDKPLEKETTVVLEYDATFFDKVKENYEGYELGNQSLISFAKTEVVVPKGQAIATFEFEVAGNEKRLVPYKFIIKGNDEVKIDEAKSHLLVNMYPADVSFTIGTQEGLPFLTIQGGQVSKVTTNTINLPVQSSLVLPEDIKVGLVRDNSLVPFLYDPYKMAPNGVEGTVAQLDMSGKQTNEFSFSLVAGDYSSFAVGTSIAVIPFKLMVYLPDGTTYTPNVTKQVEYYVEVIANTVAITKAYDSSSTEYSEIEFLTPVDNSSFTLATISQQYLQYPRRMTDGDENTFAILKATSNTNPTLKFTFNKTKKIKAIRIKTETAYSLKTMRVRTTTSPRETGLEVKINATFTPNKDGYAIIFGEPVELRRIHLDYFGAGNEIHIQEIEFFEE